MKFEDGKFGGAQKFLWKIFRRHEWKQQHFLVPIEWQNFKWRIGFFCFSLYFDALDTRFHNRNLETILSIPRPSFSFRLDLSRIPPLLHVCISNPVISNLSLPAHPLEPKSRPEVGNRNRKETARSRGRITDEGNRRNNTLGNVVKILSFQT